ncbi:MAG: hypothetical protein Kow0069_09550 [Promethearchaeota archaeon]
MRKFVEEIDEILNFVKRYLFGDEEKAVAPEVPAELPEDVEVFEYDPPDPDVEELPPPFVCVDGSFVNLLYLKALDANITLFRVSTIEYRFKDKRRPELVRHSVYDKFAIVMAKESLFPPQSPVRQMVPLAVRFPGRTLDLLSNLMMYVLEENALLAAARRYENAIIARDGTLAVVFFLSEDHVMQEILRTCERKNNAFVGVSKDTTSRYVHELLVDEAVLQGLIDGKPTLKVVRVPKSRVRVRFPPNVFGEIFFAHLNRWSDRFFRVDVGVPKRDFERVFKWLAWYSTWEGTPGFPFPLVEAHKSAKSVRDMKPTYEEQLIHRCRALEIPDDFILQGLLDDYGVADAKFHARLDRLSMI